MRPRALLVAALLVLAGCSGLHPPGSGPDEPADTVTPVPVPAADDDQLPPGATSDGIVNATSLDRAHRSALANRSWTRRGRAAVVYENGSVYDASSIRRIVDDRNGTAVEILNWSSRGGPSNLSRVTRWTNGTVRAVRREYRNGSTGYELQRAESADLLVRPGSPAYLLDRYEATPRSERSFEGSTTYQFVGDGVTDVPFRSYESVAQTGEGRLLAVVTADGFVRSTRLRAPVRIGRARGLYVIDDEYELGGTSVGRPDWVAAAAERDGPDASPTPASEDA